MTTFNTAADELNAFKKANAATQIEMLSDAGIYDAEAQPNAKTRTAAFVAYVESKNYEVTDQPEEATTTTEEAVADEPVEETTEEAPEETTEEPKQENVGDDEVYVALDKKAKDRLAELSDEILLNRRQEIFVPENMPTPKERRESKFQMGAALKEARGMFPSDKQFGEWVTQQINDPLLESEEGVIPQKTLYNYRKLAEFGTYEECESIGFTNVYKISQDGNEELLTQVRGMLDGVITTEDGDEYSDKEVSLYVKDIISPPKSKTFSQEQVDEMLDGYVDEDRLEEMREDAQAGAMEELYLGYFGIEPDEFTTETIKVQHRAAMKRFHPDHHGNAYITDFHFANNAFEFLRRRLL